MTWSDARRTVDDLRAHGAARVEGFLDAKGVENLRAELHEYYFKSDSERRGRCMVNPVHLARGLIDALPNMVEIFSQDGIRIVGKNILGHGWYVSHIILDYSDDDSRPIITWHVDNGSRGIADPDYFVLKFQIYLDEATPGSGATAYAPGSHHLTSFLRSQLKGIGRTDMQITSLPDVMEAWDLVCDAGVAVPQALQNVVDLIRREIRAEGEPDSGAFGDRWPAGSMMIFNDNGLHWAGPVQGGHRFIVRFYARPFHTDDVFLSFRQAAAMGARIMFAAFPGQRLRPLLFNV